MNDIAKTTFTLSGIFSAAAGVFFLGYAGLDLLASTSDFSRSTKELISMFSNDLFKDVAVSFMAMSSGFGMMGAASCVLPKKILKKLECNA